MLKKISVVVLLLVLTVLFAKCYVLHKYMRSDNELSEHYSQMKCKPAYRSVPFLNKKIHYAVMSKNDSLPLLVFVHGAPGAWYGYMNLMDDTTLQKKFKMIAVDRLGYGKSEYGQAETSTALQALSIKEIIEKENLSHKKVTLVGRSYGAPITAWLAINYPQKFDRLFMISPVIDPDKEKFFWFSGAGTWAAVQWVLPELLNVATAEKFAHEKEMAQMLPKWKNLYIPTVVVSGETDRIADTANFSFAKRNLVNCDTTLMMLKNTGHLVTYERPQIIKDLLLRTEKGNNKSISLNISHK
ncbi:MAG: alpha/beta hydrolase [Bacteroidetes bacterium]|nr:alpha/beta hydrolase [Bacteroidota bacterium]